MASSTEKQPVALVTAGARRLGKAFALHLATMGYNIALQYRTSKDDAEITAREVEKLGRNCQLFKRNFKNCDEVLTLIPEITQAMSAPSLLINNASVFERNTLVDTKPEDFDTDFDVHVKAPYFLIRDFARECKQGHIINIVDSSVVRYGTEYFSYLLSKKSLLELTRMAAKELAPMIRVNAIAPGMVLAQETQDRKNFDKSATANPLRRAASVDDVLKAMEYLINNEQLTGQCQFVDGGDLIDY